MPSDASTPTPTNGSVSSPANGAIPPFPLAPSEVPLPAPPAAAARDTGFITYSNGLTPDSTDDPPERLADSTIPPFPAVSLPAREVAVNFIAASIATSAARFATTETSPPSTDNGAPATPSARDILPKTPPRNRFRDQRPGLALFGAAWMFLGFVAASAIPAEIARSGVNWLLDWQSSLPGLLWHGLPAIVLIAVGLGSLFGRRWARNLIVGATLCGMSLSLTLLAAAIIFGRGSLWPEPTAEGLVSLGTLLAFMIFLWLVFAFYSSDHTRATCEALDPKPQPDRIGPTPK